MWRSLEVKCRSQSIHFQLAHGFVPCREKVWIGLEVCQRPTNQPCMGVQWVGISFGGGLWAKIIYDVVFDVS